MAVQSKRKAGCVGGDFALLIQVSLEHRSSILATGHMSVLSPTGAREYKKPEN
jgi:hypothetical protein